MWGSRSISAPPSRLIIPLSDSSSEGGRGGGKGRHEERGGESEGRGRVEEKREEGNPGKREEERKRKVKTPSGGENNKLQHKSKELKLNIKESR